MTNKELLKTKRAIDLADKITDLILHQGYDGSCIGDEFSSVMQAIIAYDAEKHVKFRKIKDEERKGFYTLDEFKLEVENGYFTDYDGHGKLATESTVSDFEVTPSEIESECSIPDWATHVVWYY